MLLNVIVFVLAICGGAVMVLTTVDYHKLLAYYRQEAYETRRAAYTLNLLFFYLFIFGYIIAAVAALLWELSRYHIFIALAFILSSLYLYFSVWAQKQTAILFRGKILGAIRAFVNAIDLKGFTFKGNSRQVYDIVRLFYEELPDYQHIINREKLLDAAILHDIGKINISTDILCKQERLTGEEWEILKSHTTLGKEMLNETCFNDIGDWILYHHERVDGNGYYGLSSHDIPIEAKIIAIADAYTALRNNRSYRTRLNHEEAMSVISREAGKQFDRKLVDCFMQMDKDILEGINAREP